MNSKRQSPPGARATAASALRRAAGGAVFHQFTCLNLRSCEAWAAFLATPLRSWGEDPVKPPSRVQKHVRPGMPAPLQHGGEVVPHELLDGQRIDPVVPEQGLEGVPEVVEPNLADAGPLDRA